MLKQSGDDYPELHKALHDNPELHKALHDNPELHKALHVKNPHHIGDRLVGVVR
jgi:hypothetical protein